MSICFATPAYGHLMYLACVQSYLALQRQLLEIGMPHAFLFTGNESLVTRARNTSVAKFLQLDYEALMFIDADIEFQPDDVAKLWNLDVPVACAAYPMKRPDSPLSAWKDGRLLRIVCSPTHPNEAPAPNERGTIRADEGPVSIDYAGTGFILIKRSVFEQIINHTRDIAHVEGHVGPCWDIFTVGVRGGVSRDDRFYASEDYSFCQQWRDLGGEVILEPSIRLRHWGTHAYG